MLQVALALGISAGQLSEVRLTETQRVKQSHPHGALWASGRSNLERVLMTPSWAGKREVSGCIFVARSDAYERARVVAEVARFAAAEERMTSLAAEVIRRRFGLGRGRATRREVANVLGLEARAVAQLEEAGLGEVARAFGCTPAVLTAGSRARRRPPGPTAAYPAVVPESKGVWN